MDKPYAITLDAGSSLANKTGAWRTNRPLYVDRLPPCNHACPAGENIQGWLYHAESGDYEAAWRALTEDNPLAAIMGRVCYHPCEGACNRGKLDEAVGINSVERFLGDEAIKKGWKFAAPAAESGKRVLVVGAGPSGLSAAYHLRRLGHAVKIVDAGPMAGGMMRFGIPKYRLPRDVLDAEVQRILDLGVELELNCKVSNILETMRAGRFDAAFLAVGAHIAKRAYIPAGEAAHMLDAVSVLRSMESEDKADAGPARRGVRRRQYRARRRAHGQAAGRQRSDHRLPADAGQDARARLRSGGSAAGRRPDQVAVDDQERGRRGHADGRKDGARRVGLPAADRRIRDARVRLADPGAGPGCRSLAARGRAGIGDQERHRAGRAEHDDGLSRHFRRRRHGAVRAHGDGRRRSRQEGGAAHSRLAFRHEVRAGTEARAGDVRQDESRGTTATRPGPCARCSSSRAARRRSTRS